MWPGRSGGHPSLQSILVAFVPLSLALNGITPEAYRLHASGGSRDLAGGTAVIFSAVPGQQQGAAQLEVRDGSSHSCSAAGWIAWPQSSAFADLFSSAVPSTWPKNLAARTAAFPGEFSLAVGP